MVRLLTLKRLFAKVDLASLKLVEDFYSWLGPRDYLVKAGFFTLVLMHLLSMSSETMLAGYLSVHVDRLKLAASTRISNVAVERPVSQR
jgi:hypothetical protein